MSKDFTFETIDLGIPYNEKNDEIVSAIFYAKNTPQFEPYHWFYSGIKALPNDNLGITLRTDFCEWIEGDSFATENPYVKWVDGKTVLDIPKIGKKLSTFLYDMLRENDYGWRTPKDGVLDEIFNSDITIVDVRKVYDALVTLTKND